MRAREDGEGRNALRVTVRDTPGDASAPIVADDMKPAASVTAFSRDGKRIFHQVIEAKICGLARIRPSTCRITALAWRYRAISRCRKLWHVRTPHMESFRKPMQEQHQRPVFGAANHHVEGEIRGCGNLLEVDHSLMAGPVLWSRTAPALPPRASWRLPGWL